MSERRKSVRQILNFVCQFKFLYNHAMFQHFFDGGVLQKQQSSSADNSNKLSNPLEASIGDVDASGGDDDKQATVKPPPLQPVKATDDPASIFGGPRKSSSSVVMADFSEDLLACLPDCPLEVPLKSASSSSSSSSSQEQLEPATSLDCSGASYPFSHLMQSLHNIGEETAEGGFMTQF